MCGIIIIYPREAFLWRFLTGISLLTDNVDLKLKHQWFGLAKVLEDKAVLYRSLSWEDRKRQCKILFRARDKPLLPLWIPGEGFAECPFQGSMFHTFLVNEMVFEIVFCSYHNYRKIKRIGCHLICNWSVSIHMKETEHCSSEDQVRVHGCERSGIEKYVFE